MPYYYISYCIYNISVPVLPLKMFANANDFKFQFYEVKLFDDHTKYTYGISRNIHLNNFINCIQIW